MPLVFVRTCFSIHFNQASRHINTAVSQHRSHQTDKCRLWRGLSRDLYPFFPPVNASTFKSLVSSTFISHWSESAPWYRYESCWGSSGLQLPVLFSLISPPWTALEPVCLQEEIQLALPARIAVASGDLKVEGKPGSELQFPLRLLTPCSEPERGTTPHHCDLSPLTSLRRPSVSIQVLLNCYHTMCAYRWTHCQHVQHGTKNRTGKEAVWIILSSPTWYWWRHR